MAFKVVGPGGKAAEATSAHAMSNLRGWKAKEQPPVGFNAERAQQDKSASPGAGCAACGSVAGTRCWSPGC